MLGSRLYKQPEYGSVTRPKWKAFIGAMAGTLVFIIVAYQPFLAVEEAFVRRFWPVLVLLVVGIATGFVMRRRRHRSHGGET
jgi:hypothetical protein